MATATAVKKTRAPEAQIVEQPTQPTGNGRKRNAPLRPRKPRGFWRDANTMAVLGKLASGKITADMAVQQLNVLPADVAWYLREYKKQGHGRLGEKAEKAA